MKWLNIEISSLRAPEYVGSDPTERATWVNVVAYCAEQENGGRVAGAREWKDRQWQQTCGVTRREVDAAGKLLIWHGDDLCVWNYPLEQEEIQRAKREGGRSGGIKSGEVRRTPSSTPSRVLQRTPSTEGKGIGKEEERNGNNTSDGVPPPPDAPVLTLEGEQPPEPPAAPKPARKRDPLFDALALATNEDPSQLTPTAGRAIGVALAEIRKASPDVTPEEIHRRAEHYRQHMPQTTLTANALKAHWGRCANPPAPRDNSVPWQRKSGEIDHSKGF